MSERGFAQLLRIDKARVQKCVSRQLLDDRSQVLGAVVDREQQFRSAHMRKAGHDRGVIACAPFEQSAG